MSNITIQGGKSETDTGCLEILLIVAVVFLFLIYEGIKEIRECLSEPNPQTVEQTEIEVKE